MTGFTLRQFRRFFGHGASATTIPTAVRATLDRWGEFTLSLGTSLASGQYINGEWFIVNPVGGPGFSWTASIPAFDANNSGQTNKARSYTGRSVHGAMLNHGSVAAVLPADPTWTLAKNFYGHSQGYDSYTMAGASTSNTGARPYDANLNIDPGALGAPFTLAAGVEGSITKANSLLTPDDLSRPSLNSLEAFHVVATVPPIGAFPPAVSSTSKVSWVKESDINYGCLQSVAPPSGMTVDGAYHASNIDRLYMVYFCNITSGCRNITPLLNHPNYGREIGYIVGDLMLALHLNTTTTGANGRGGQRAQIVYGIISVAIDIVGRIDEGGWYVLAGGGEGWRKSILVMAACLTAGTAAGTRFAAYASRLDKFNEDYQFDYVSNANANALPVFNDGYMGFYTRGSGYTVGDILTMVGGIAITPAVFTVRSVDASGAIILIGSGAGGGGTIAKPAANIRPDNYTTVQYIEEPDYTAGAALSGGSGTGASLYNPRVTNAMLPFMEGSPTFHGDGRTDAAKLTSGSNWLANSYLDIVGGELFGQVIAVSMTTAGKAMWNNPALFDWFDWYWNHEKPGALAVNSLGATNNASDLGRGMWPLYRNDNSAAVPAVEVSAAQGQYVWRRYDALLDVNSVPAPGDFAVRVNGTVRTVTRLMTWGRAIGLWLATPVAATDVVTWSYTPGATPMRNVRGVAVPAFANAATVNLT